MIELDGELEASAIATSEMESRAWISLRDKLAAKLGVERWLLHPGARVGRASLVWSMERCARLPDVIDVLPASLVLSGRVRSALLNAGVDAAMLHSVAGGDAAFDDYFEVVVRSSAHFRNRGPEAFMVCKECERIQGRAMGDAVFDPPTVPDDFLGVKRNPNQLLVSSRVASVLAEWIPAKAIDEVDIA